MTIGRKTQFPSKLHTSDKGIIPGTFLQNLKINTYLFFFYTLSFLIIVFHNNKAGIWVVSFFDRPNTRKLSKCLLCSSIKKKVGRSISHDTLYFSHYTHANILTRAAPNIMTISRKVNDIIWYIEEKNKWKKNQTSGVRNTKLPLYLTGIMALMRMDNISGNVVKMTGRRREVSGK